MKKYISDIITEEEIAKWDMGEDIRVLGATGSGKSYWALHVLAPYCRKSYKTRFRGANILYLTHRVALRQQVIKDTILSAVDDVVEVRTYQNIIMQYKNNILDLDSFDFIVYDEFQFLINDSDFVADTEIIYHLMHSSTNHTQIFISANDMDIGMRFDREYKVGDTTKDISDRINNAFLLPHNNNMVSLIDEILNNTDDKVFCYINNNSVIKDIYKAHEKDTMLYVSESSPLSKYMNEVDTEMFTITNQLNKRVLLTTSAFDAGVSIKDDAVKHIIVEERDLEQLYQVIGRKRLVGDEKFDLYIVNLPNQRIAGYQTQLMRDLEQIKEFAADKNKFCRLHGRDKLDNTIFYNDEDGVLQLNVMAIYKLKNLGKQYNEYIEYGYRNVVEKEFNIKFIDVEFEKQKENLETYLDSIVGKRLYKEEQQELIKQINLKDSRGRVQKAFTTLEAYLENETNFRLIRKINYSKVDMDTYRKTYWQVI